MGDRVEQWVERVVDDEVEERSGLLLGPHHHRIRHLAGPLPQRHPLRRPQLRLRPLRRRQLDQFRHVVGQQALIHRRPQDRPQSLFAPVQRRRPDRTLPLHRRDLAPVTAGPELGDHLVTLHDRLEHRFQMPHPQPVTPNPTQMRPQVETDVRLVGAVHVPADSAILQRQERVEHRIHHRMLQHWSAGLDETANCVDLGQWPLIRDQSRQQVPDLPQRLVVVRLGDPEQVSHPVETFLSLRRRLIPTAPPRPPVPPLVLRQLDPEIPLPMPLVRQPRTRITERLPVPVPARTPPEH